MWTVENRPRYDRSKLRYPSDLTDDEWALARPEIPRARTRHTLHEMPPAEQSAHRKPHAAKHGDTCRDGERGGEEDEKRREDQRENDPDDDRILRLESDGADLHQAPPVVTFKTTPPAS